MSIVLDNYKKHLSPKSSPTFAREAEKFLKYSNNKLDKDSVEGYIKKLQKSYKPSSVHFIFNIIHRLFVTNNVSWTFIRGEGPSIPEGSEERPALEPALIKQMIKTCRDGVVGDTQTSLLCLSSIYGLRRTEMVGLKESDVDTDRCLLYVDTAKHGNKRHHMIPNEIIPYIAKHNYDITLYEASAMFWDIVAKSNLRQLEKYRLGYHSIRRTLDTLLLQSGLDIFTVASFMRWKVAQSSGIAMPQRYYSTNWVGTEGIKPVAIEATEDSKIWEVHPFLQDWC